MNSSVHVEVGLFYCVRKERIVVFIEENQTDGVFQDFHWYCLGAKDTCMFSLSFLAFYYFEVSVGVSMFVFIGISVNARVVIGFRWNM